jgi:hypothetical protein
MISQPGKATLYAHMQSMVQDLKGGFKVSVAAGLAGTVDPPLRSPRNLMAEQGSLDISCLGIWAMSQALSAGLGLII